MDIKIKNRHRLKTKEIKKILTELQNIFDFSFFNEKTIVEVGEIENQKLILINGTPCFMYYKNKILFTLHGLNIYKPKNKYVVVDRGAIKFITNGADVMSPGITDADKNIHENDQVWICDETYHKPLAVGIALINGEQMIQSKKGKAVSIIHYVGDKIWSFSAKVYK